MVDLSTGQLLTDNFLVLFLTAAHSQAVSQKRTVYGESSVLNAAAFMGRRYRTHHITHASWRLGDCQTVGQ